MPLPLLLDLAFALCAGLLALAAMTWVAHSPVAPARPALDAARAAGEAVAEHGRLRTLLTRRLDRAVASGFLLTLAVGAAFVGGLALGVLAYLVRSLPALRHLDRSVAAWGYHHRSALSTHGLDLVTRLGSAPVVIALAVVLAAFQLFRARNRWSVLFLVVVLCGMELITWGVKDLMGRARPTLVPAAAKLGPSFPSGHSATSAAFYAAAALIIGRRLRPGGRRALAAAAVAIAVAVAGSRVLLDLHWLSDVIGGLALGWGWFALSAAVFGGRLLRPTAAVDAAAAAAAGPGAGGESGRRLGGAGLPRRQALP